MIVRVSAVLHVVLLTITDDPKNILVYHPQITLNLNVLTLCTILGCSGHAVHQFSKGSGAKLK